MDFILEQINRYTLKSHAPILAVMVKSLLYKLPMYQNQLYIFNKTIFIFFALGY